jgi:oxygen-independent coproporphyrinogen-3 oxidase
LQAWQNQLLQELGRIHEIEDFINTYNLARSIGFNNISVDLMFSLPNQSLNQWRETIGNVCQLKPDHLSCYSLKLEEGTVLNDKYQKGIINIPSDEADREMYHTAIDMLKAYGYKQYEISNFSKPNKECKHNLVYWNNEEYLGIGAGSHSKLNHKRFWNHKSIDRYIDSLINYAAPIESYEDINRDEDMWESIFLALRLNKGLDILKFQETYNVNFMEKYSEALNKLVLQKLIIIEGKNIKLTPLGMDLSNQVFMEFM